MNNAAVRSTVPRYPTSLLLKPVSSDCNLRCDYCFYRRVAAIYPDRPTHLMPEDVLEAVIEQFLEMRLPQSPFCWQGGEPTLAGLDFFERVVRLQMRHGAAGQVVANSLQTNGLLLDEDWARFLRKYRFLVGLSLDGPRRYHDRYRRDAAGRGSFEKVMAAVELLRRFGVEFNILAMITPANCDHAADVYDFLLSLGVRYMQFIPCLEMLPKESGSKPGLPAPYSVTVEQYGGFLTELYREWRRSLASRPVSIRLFDGIMNLQHGREPAMCIFNETCDSYVVVEHNGDVYPCDFFVQPKWLLGNIMEEGLEGASRSERRREFALLKSKTNKTCRRCRWIEICRGGCIKDRVHLGGRPHEPTFLCAAYKRIFARLSRDFAAAQY